MLSVFELMSFMQLYVDSYSRLMMISISFHVQVVNFQKQHFLSLIDLPLIKECPFFLDINSQLMPVYNLY